MNDEIKETIKWLNQIIKENKEGDVSLKCCVIPFETLYKLQDCITTLQHSLWEEQELSELFKDKYEKMKENAEILSNGYNELEKRNEDALEYIKKEFADIEFMKKEYKDIDKIYDTIVEIDVRCINKLNNILTGDDSDE